MQKKQPPQQPLSELRQDLVSGNWTLISPARAARPHAPTSAAAQKQITKANCPFEDLIVAAGGKKPLLQYGTSKLWRLGIIENKYPALRHEAACPAFFKDGPYQHLGGVGRHEILVTRDHQKNFSQLSPGAAFEVFLATAERFRALKEDPCLQYMLLFQNYGVSAGASQPHPHYQIITTPVTPPGVAHSLEGARQYFEKHQRCVHCVMINHELKAKKRIIYENEHAVVFAPFASTYKYELRVFPKHHHARFEQTPEEELSAVSLALQKALGALRKSLRDPDYNFLVHTAPLKDESSYKRYHWHIEITPRLQIFAGFEIGTGMVINPVAPEDAAAILRKYI